MKDNFSKQADLYAQYRPAYPDALIRQILQHVNERNVAWDCATGNGQAAHLLSKYFDTVYATDISANQLAKAVRADNIHYAVGTAEETSFDNNMFNLITVAQAIHWFHFSKFYAEVKRTGKPGCILAVIGYGLVETSGKLQEQIRHFYKHIVGPYWDKERTYVDEAYTTIPFPFIELEPLQMRTGIEWSFEQLIGFLNTWSAVQHYIQANDTNPVDLVYADLKAAWGDDTVRYFYFPIFTRIGRIDK